jgi:hypothetical protein
MKRLVLLGTTLACLAVAVGCNNSGSTGPPKNTNPNAGPSSDSLPKPPPLPVPPK